MGRRIVIAGLALAVVLTVSACGGGPGATSGDQSQSNSSTHASESDSNDGGILTPETSEDVAALFAGPTYGKAVLEAFVDAHQGEQIEFDGHISFLINSEKAVYSTAFVSLGDAQSPSPTGPMFEFGPVLLPETSPLQQADLSEGQNVHVRGIIGSTYAFEESTTYHPESEDRIVLLVDRVESR